MKTYRSGSENPETQEARPASARRLRLRVFLSRHRAVLLFIALLAYLYFRGIGDHGLLDPIEGVNASVGLTMLSSGEYLVPRIGESACAGRTIGTWWLSALSFYLFGWGEFAARFWPALSGLLMALAAALAAERRRGAWLSAAVCASMTLGFAVSQIASSHALYACCTGFAMAAFLRVPRIENTFSQKQRWIFLAHGASVLGLLAHGPEGVILPWLILLLYSCATGRFDTLKQCLTCWPATAMTLLIIELYILVFRLGNPMFLHLLGYEAPRYAAFGLPSVLFLILAGTVPWPGFFIQAVIEVVPVNLKRLRDRFRLPYASRSSSPDAGDPKFFMAVWTFMFCVFALLQGDLLALTACVPAASALTGDSLDDWMEKGKISSIQDAAAWDIFILLFLVLIGLPLALKFFPVLRGALLSLFPWGLFIAAFIFEAWNYARKRKPLKLARNLSGIALLCLMPLAGVFNLVAEEYSLREIGLTLHGTLRQNDVLIQYAANRPSLYFYTMRNYALLNSPLFPGMESKKFIINDNVMFSLWAGQGRVFMLLPKNYQPLSPLPRDVHNIAETDTLILLGNRPDTGGPVRQSF